MPGPVIFGLAMVLSALFIGLAFLKHPGWALFGYYNVAFMRPNELDWVLASWQFSLAFVATFMLSSIWHVVRNGYQTGGGLTMKVQVIMVVHMWICGQMLGSQDLLYAPLSFWNKFDFYWKMTIVVFIGTRVIDTPKWMYRGLWMISFSGAFLGFWANYCYYVLGYPEITGPGPAIGLWEGLFPDRNDFAMMLAISIAAAWYQAAMAKRWWHKGLWLLAIPVLGNGVLLTESRGGILGVAASLAYITYRSRHRITMAAVNTAACTVAFMFFTGDALKDRYTTISNYDEDTSALSRLNSWKVGLQMAQNRPFTGVGLENFVPAFYDHTEWRPEFRVRRTGELALVYDADFEIYSPHQAHNMWVQRAGEAGATGLIILILYVGSVVINIWRVRRIVAKLDHPDKELVQKMTLNMEGTLASYLVCGFFLSQEDFEYLYVIGMMAMNLVNWANRVADSASAAADASVEDGRARGMAPPRHQIPGPATVADAGGTDFRRVD